MCRDRKVQPVGLADVEHAHAEALRAQLADVHALPRRFALATPNKGRWDAAWHTLQTPLREVRSSLAGVVVPPAG